MSEEQVSINEKASEIVCIIWTNKWWSWTGSKVHTDFITRLQLKHTTSRTKCLISITCSHAFSIGATSTIIIIQPNLYPSSTIVCKYKSSIEVVQSGNISNKYSSWRVITENISIAEYFDY